MILAPYGQLPDGVFPTESGGSIGSDGRYLCPPDAQYDTSGEGGYYHDTPLGQGGESGPQLISQGPVPSDFQHATAYQYTPSSRGWVATPTGYIQGGYYPQPPGSAVYPASAPALGNAQDAAQAAAQTAINPSYMTEAQAAKEQRDRILFWVSVVSGSIVATSALLAVYRSLKGLRHDQMIRAALEKKLV